MMQIAVLGCGWLGLPLAKAFIANGYTVKGSVTTAEKIPLLQKAGITPCIITLSEDSANGNIHDFLSGSNMLVINIPPKVKTGENFTAKSKAFIPYIEKAGIHKVLFISSTSVYADDNTVVTEETQPNPQTESGRQLLETEKLLRDNPHFKTTILRFGGLVGEDRHPVHHLAGRQGVANPDAPVNLIHRDDCIGIILNIAKSNCWGETFNAAFPEHPSREAYYTAKANGLGLEVPEFSRERKSEGKSIDSGKIENRLGYRFRQKP